MAHHDEISDTIRRNSDMVYRLAFAQMKNRTEADDVYQEVFYRYIRKQPVFDSPEHERAWFVRVTLNCSRTMMRSFWNTRVAPLTDDILDTMPMPEDDLARAIKKLPKQYSAVIHLFYYEDMSIRDIADTLGLSTGNVGMLLTRARRKLKEILDKENYYEK